jgi:hypothetical protein
LPVGVVDQGAAVEVRADHHIAEGHP